MEATLSIIHDLFQKNIHGVRRFGAAALDLAMVGCGRFDGFFELHLQPWDFAAGRLFVEEAGGILTDLNRTPSLSRKVQAFLPRTKSSIR